MKLTTQKRIIMLALAASMGAGISACAPILVGGAVMGSMVATDRRTTGTQVEDEGIELHASSRVRDTVGERAHVNITSYNRKVLLTGEVPTTQDKQLIEQTVSRVENVRSIVNELAVMGNSSLSERAADTLITGRFKASMVDSRDLFSNAFKVVTERGTLFLMGRVTQREANRATDIARGTSNVRKVVRLLEIISEEELQNLQPKPAANETRN